MTSSTLGMSALLSKGHTAPTKGAFRQHKPNGGQNRRAAGFLMKMPASTKHELRKKSEARSPKQECQNPFWFFSFGHSCFFRHSCFVLHPATLTTGSRSNGSETPPACSCRGPAERRGRGGRPPGRGAQRRPDRSSGSARSRAAPARGSA